MVLKKEYTVVVIITALLVGAGCGYFYGQSPIAELREDVAGQVAQFQEQLVEIEDYIERLKNEKEGQITTLQDKISERDGKIEGLQSQVTELEESLENLNYSYKEMLLEYDELLRDYTLLNAPVSTFTSADELDFVITTHKRIYSYTEPISGNVTIYYHNGSAFKGTFSVYIECVGVAMSSGWISNVNGYGEFFVKSPAFMHGPGIYRVGFCYLYDMEGFIVATSRDISHIYVTVEAK